MANSLPDIDPDEVYAALDADTRPYLKLLVAGAGKGLRDRGDDLREVFRRFEPIHRDLARVTRASAKRRGALKELIHDYGLLMTELGKHPQDLRRLVTASRTVFDALANEDDRDLRVGGAAAGLAARYRARAHQVQQFAPVLRSSLESLREPIRKLPATNEAVIPFLRETEPVIRTQIRPFVRAARPWTDDLRLAAEGTAKAMPDLKDSFGELNRFFNIGAFNPGGAEGLDGKSISEQRQRQEGFLYWLAWVPRTAARCSRALTARAPGAASRSAGPGGGPDRHREWRPRGRGGEQPRARRPAHRVTSPGGSSAVDQLLATQFGSCNFNALPSTPPPGRRR